MRNSFLIFKKQQMKIYLDDLRPTPVGWHRVYTAQETIDTLLNNKTIVTDISLDNDLGVDANGDLLDEGYTVLDKIEELLYFGQLSYLPNIQIHSANPVAKIKMQTIIQKLKNNFGSND